MRAALVVLVAIAAIGGCSASVPLSPPEPRMQFVDLPRFDQDLAAGLGARLPEVEVAFLDRVPPSNVPERLQKWLAAVESHGGKVKVSPPPGSVTAKNPLLLVSALTTLWSAHKMSREAIAESRFASTRNFDAEMLLRNDDQSGVVIDRIVFRQRQQ